MMKYRTLFPPKYRFLRLLDPVVDEVRELRGSSNVAWKSRRLLGTAAAREIPPADRVKRKRVSKEERKDMVVEYANKYRMMNAGKFPTAKDTKKQVGGCYYVVRSILQEMEYNSKLPTVATTDKTSVAGQTTKVTKISEVREALDTDVPLNTAIVANNHKISAEDGFNSQHGISEVRKVVGDFSAEEGSSNQGEVDSSCQRMVDMDACILTKNSKMVVGDILGSETLVDLKVHREYEKMSTADMDKGKNNGFMDSSEVLETRNLEKATVHREHEKMSTADMDKGGNNGFLDSSEVLETRNLEKATVDETGKATTMVSEFPSKSDHPSEAISSCWRTEFAEIDEASSPTSESDQFTRKTLQTTKEKSSLWGNLKNFASSFMSIWRKQ